MAGSRTYRFPKLMVGAVDVADKWTAQDLAVSTHTDDATLHRAINDAATGATDLWSASKINTELASKADTPITPATDIPDDSLAPSMLDIDNAETDTYVLSYDLASTSFKWVERAMIDGSNLDADSISEASLAINTAAGAGVDNFAICWDNGNTRLDYMEMMLPDLSNLSASITEAMLDVNNAPTDTYALVWNDAAGKMEWTDIAAAVGSDTYKVKWDAGDGEDYLDQKIPNPTGGAGYDLLRVDSGATGYELGPTLDSMTGHTGKSAVVNTGETGLTYLSRLTRITSNTTFYLSPTGNDTTGDGTVGTPWKSLAKCLTYLRDFVADPNVTVTISLAAGTYSAMASVTINTISIPNLIIAGASYATTFYEFSAGGIYVRNCKVGISGIDFSGAGGNGINVANNGFIEIDGNGIKVSGGFDAGIKVSYGSYIKSTGSIYVANCNNYLIDCSHGGYLHTSGQIEVDSAPYGIQAVYGSTVNSLLGIIVYNCTNTGIFAYACSTVMANSYLFLSNTLDTNFAITTVSGTPTFGGFGSVIIDR